MKILVYPSFNNPYQELLYSQLLRKYNVEYTYFDDKSYKKHISLGVLFAPMRLLYFRLNGYNIFHLHWQDFVIPVPNPLLQRFLSTVYAVIYVFYLKVLGYKIIWTIHNIIPHDKKFVNDLFITKLFSSVCDAKIVHSTYIIDEMKRMNINAKDTYVIPMGNFIGYYPNTITREEARKKLNINKNSFVFLLFGVLRRYKGIDSLLKAFSDISRKYENATLIIAGESPDKEYIDTITKENKHLVNKLILHPYHIPDNEIQTYMIASDMVILPFERITTSSSTILAMSYKKPIIYPLLTSLKDFPDNVGISYKPDESHSLYNAMNNALSSSDALEKYGKNGYGYVSKFTWDKMADQTFAVYTTLSK